MNLFYTNAMNYFLSVAGVHSLTILIVREVLLTMLTNCDQLIGLNVLDIDIAPYCSEVGHKCYKQTAGADKQ